MAVRFRQASEQMLHPDRYSAFLRSWLIVIPLAFNQNLAPSLSGRSLPTNQVSLTCFVPRNSIPKTLAA
jgi:hypothetical protein